MSKVLVHNEQSWSKTAVLSQQSGNFLCKKHLKIHFVFPPTLNHSKLEASNLNGQLPHSKDLFGESIKWTNFQKLLNVPVMY